MISNKNPIASSLRTATFKLRATAFALGAAILAATVGLAMVPNIAHAGPVENGLEHAAVLAAVGVAEHVAENEFRKYQAQVSQGGYPKAQAARAAATTPVVYTTPIPGVNSPLALPAGDGLAGCAQLFPRGIPPDLSKMDPHWGVVPLCSNFFAVVNSALTKSPLFCAEKLNRAQMASALNESRSNEFYPDPRLARGARAELSDFKGSGKDRGHACPAGDEPDAQSMIQSFALSNMMMQDPYNNQHPWAKIESDTRKYVRHAQGDVFVFTGPLFRGPVTTMGANHVWIPTHLFKLVYDSVTTRAWVYVMENTASAQIMPPISYQEFVRQTGWALLSNVPVQ